MFEENVYIEAILDVPLEKENIFGKDIFEDLNILLSICIKYIQDPDIENITRAFYFTYDAHKGIKRSSGEPYYTHPLKVVKYLLEDLAFYDNASVIAALLHDTVEDNKHITLENIQEKFGTEIAHIVDGVTKIKGKITQNLDKAATYSKLFENLIQNVRVILVKLADRLDNMKTLQHLPRKKQLEIAEETLNFYTPFAQRLGLTKVKKQLEDLSLYFKDEKKFNEINNKLKEKRLVFIDNIRNLFATVTQKLNERNIPHIITIEHKHIYEIYKMIESGKSLDKIDNFYSLVIIIKSNDFSEAYRTYGIIASLFGPVSSLDDYIARPKINLYRALHSTHFGPGNKLIEVIIRTEAMEKIDEKGILGYHTITNLLKPLLMENQDIIEWLEWMKDLINSGDPDAIQQIWGSIKINLYDDDLIAHTKDGKSYHLPKGSCPIDLAFNISDDVGYHCISAKVNDQIKSLDYEIQNNDHVEIITSPKSKPDPKWQNFVITHKAVVKLHKYFKNYNLAKNNNEDKNLNTINIRIKADARKNLLDDIKFEIGQNNIQRIYLHNFNSEFEALIKVNKSATNTNNIFTRLLLVKGIISAEKIN